jgi:hypothetical protein
MSYPLPKGDGDVNVYIHREARSTSYWQPNRTVIFINGMANSPRNHLESAVALSKLQMCQVVGVFNQSSGTVRDLFQCLADKWQWNGIGPGRSFDQAKTAFYKLLGSRAKAEQAIMESLARNAAAVALFKEIRSRQGNMEIFAHSQGNLILSNALIGLQMVDSSALGRITVHSYGSPTVYWPDGFVHYDHGFTFDPVNWLSGFDSSFSISKVGVPTTPEFAGVVSHGFKTYLADDATFVVNRFRWGSFGLTASMDEEGLATALASMGTNIPRIRAIFRRLSSAHWSDVDDVAVLYVHKIKHNASVLNAVRSDDPLRQLLIKSLDEGYTSGREYEAIEILK